MVIDGLQMCPHPVFGHLNGNPKTSVSQTCKRAKGFYRATFTGFFPATDR